MIRVDVPDHKTFVEFPDGTPPQEIERVLKESFPEQPSTMSKVGGMAKQAVEPYVGLAEGAMSTLSGLAAAPIAGLGGLAKTITSGPEAGTKTIEEMSKALTYQPKTEMGEAAAELGGKAMDVVVGQPSRAVGELGYKVAGPVGGAAAETAFQMAIPGAVMGKMKAKPSLGEVAKKIPDPAQRTQFVKDVAQEVKATGKTLDEVIANRMQEGEAIKVKEQRLAAEVEGLRKNYDAQYGTPKTEPVTPTPQTTAPSLEAAEAMVKGGAIRREPARYAEGSAINLDRLDMPEDAKAFMEFLTRANAEAIGRRPVGWEETRQKGIELGWAPKDVMKAWKEKGSLASHEMDAARQIHANSFMEYQDFIRNLPAEGQRTPEMKSRFLELTNNYLNVMEALSPASSEAGRTLNIHKRIISQDPFWQQQSNFNAVLRKVNEALDQYGIGKKADDLINKLQSIDWQDTEAVNNLIREFHKPKTADIIREVWLNGILSSAKTQERNIIGSVLSLAWKPMETVVASTLELPRGKGRNVYYGESGAYVYGALNGIKDGTRAFAKAWRTGLPAEEWGKVETNRIPAIPGKTGEIVRTPTRTLTAVDEFFKTVIQRASIAQQSYNTAARQSLKGEAFVNRLAELKDRPTEKMLEKAHRDALGGTFNLQLGPLGNVVMKLRDGIPYNIGWFVATFVRTPINLAKWSLERTPMNAVKIMRDYKRGKIPKEELTSELAKPLIGSMLMLETMALVGEGLVTGSGPKEKTKREALKRTGWQEYSVKIGDKYVSYKYFAPLANVVGMAADLGEMIYDKKFPTDERKFKQYVGEVAFSFARNITSQTFMQGFSQAIDAISDPERYGEKMLEQFAGSVVPSIVKDVAMATDPTVREMETPLDAIQSRIPGASQNLISKRDLWGRKINREGGPIGAMINPTTTSTATNDRVDNEMVRLGLHPGMPGKKIKGVELDPKEYGTYVEKAGERSRQFVERFINSDNYPNVRDEIKKVVIQNMIEKARIMEGTRLWAQMERKRALTPIYKKYGIQGGQ